MPLNNPNQTDHIYPILFLSIYCACVDFSCWPGSKILTGIWLGFTWCLCKVGHCKLIAWSHGAFSPGRGKFIAWCPKKEMLSGWGIFLWWPCGSFDSCMSLHYKMASCKIWLGQKSHKSLTPLPIGLGRLQNTPTVSLQRVKTTPYNQYPGYDTKQSNGEVPVMLELWGMRCTPSLLLLPGPLWPGVVAPDRVLSLSNRTVWDLNWVQTNDLC